MVLRDCVIGLVVLMPTAGELGRRAAALAAEAVD
jgi:hypothetical protein